MSISRIVFLIILIATYRTKIDYTYLIWFFILNDAPGRLFSAGVAASVGRLPFYPIAAGVSLSFSELFIILYLIKTILKKDSYCYYFRKEFTWFLLFGIVISLYSLLLGMNLDNIIRTFRALLPWVLVFIIPKFINDKTIFIRVCVLVCPIVFLALISQIFNFITGFYFEAFITGKTNVIVNLEEGNIYRSYSSIYITFFAIIHALFLFINNGYGLNRIILGITVFIGYLTIFLSATRGWIISLSFFFIGTFFLLGMKKEIPRWFRFFIISSLVLMFIMIQFPFIKQQMISSYERLATVQSIFSGDITAEGTLSRLDVRGPKVLSKFKESPILGWGFSNEYYKYADGHVGHHNLLLNVGIIGYMLLTYIFIIILRKMWMLIQRNKSIIIEGTTPIIYIVGLVSVYIIHSTSTQFWGYYLHADHIDKVLFFSFFFAAFQSVYYLPLEQKS